MRIVITGGAGFLARHTMQELRDLAAKNGETLELVSFDLASSAAADRSIVADVTDPESVSKGFAGADVVLHMASMIDWGTRPLSELERVNVQGTRCVIEACKARAVKALIYTSSLDVLHDGTDHVDIDESVPYPRRFQDGYAATKARAEQLIIAANSSALATCALRPGGIFGGGDPYHVDNILREARRGLPFRIGAPSVVFQHVYVGNVAYAHALAAFAMREGGAKIAGNAYFCTDIPAENFFELLRPFVEAKGYKLPPPHRCLPDVLAYGLGAAAETLGKLLPRRFGYRPKLTRSSVRALTRTYSVKSERLARDLGYTPRYSREQAFERTLAHYRDHDP
jgi:nucleoside-diphosphate-sugar epimerase